MVQQRSNLILYTPRTGSTILAEILSASSEGTNYNEGIVDSYKHHQAFRQSLQRYIIEEVVHNNKYNFVPYHIEKQKRIDILKSSSNWTVKETCMAFLTNVDFIKYCCDSKDINVYMVYRKDVVAQFRSFVNMSGKLKPIYRVADRGLQRSCTVSDKTIATKLPVLVESLIYWRLLYEKFKGSVTLVCYDDVIKPMNFSNLGIDKSVVDNYNLRDNHIIPTPFEYVDRTDDKWLSAINTMSDLKWITNTL